MKKDNLSKLLFILLCFPVQLFAQDITGLWKGTLYNDTTRQNLYYEVAISEEDGKLSGYSYTVFDVEGKEEVGVKKLKIKRKDDKIQIEDIELISNNYSSPPPKGVHQYSVVTLKNEDSVLVLSGTWNTNRTKQYHSLTGTLRLQRKNDFRQTALVKKLDSMKLTPKLSFMPPEKRSTEVAVADQPKMKTTDPDSVTVVKKRSIKKPEPVALIEKPKERKRAEEKLKTVTTEKPKEKKPAEIKKIEPEIIKPVIIPPAEDVAKRKIVNTQLVYYVSDSLILSLYDNGEVDGDTVSVLMNGQVLFARAGLTTKANSKTIYINKDTPDSILLVMYAENLGSIPPNTGLLVVRDGESIYETRFSADLQSNAQIILRRKKKE